jgi:hypothetical protein
VKLLFEKNEDSQINVFQIVNGNNRDFSYIDMINALIESKVMEKPEILDGFTEAEIKSINSMVTFINKEISATEPPDPTA